jgi:CelD/BcsL family acetyltransferase involved in cellulose biosynthesis
MQLESLRALQASGQPFAHELGGIASSLGLEAFAHMPTQLPCFLTAASGAFLADAVVEEMLGLAADGTIALLPLCRGKERFARWRIVGSREVFEPVDALACSTEAMAALAEALARQPRPLAFDRIPAESPLIPAVQAAMKGKGWISLRPAVARPVITLDASWSDPAARFNTGRQSDFRRAARKAERHGTVAYEVLAPTPAEFDALFDEAVTVELRSWKKQSGTAIGVDRRKRDFFQRFFRAAAQDGLCRIAFMRIDGRPAAMQLALEWHGRFWLFKIGYDEAFRDCSPGNLLMLHTIGHAATRGLASYELLGNTEDWISTFWTKEQLPCLRLRTYPANLRGAWAAASDALSCLSHRLARRWR